MDNVADIIRLAQGVAKDYIKKYSYVLPAIRTGISNRHVHLSRHDIDILFGEKYCLTKLRDLSQTGQYAATETVSVTGPKGSIGNLRILGPERDRSQVELLMSDSYTLGIRPPVRDSGDIDGTPGILISGPGGDITIKEGAIIAARHIHINNEEARSYNLTDCKKVTVRTRGLRALEFKNVLVRIHPTFRAEFHIDMDEANAAGLVAGDIVEISNCLDRGVI